MEKRIPWNKGKRCPQISKSLKGNIPWNKGLTKEQDSRLAYKNSTQFGKMEHHLYWKDGVYVNNPKKYKHEWYLKNKEQLTISYKIRYENKKHDKEFVKRREEYRKSWRKKNPLMVKAQDLKRRTLSKGLITKTIQLVYEDNIKKFGTLTCYLCEKPIQFGKDHLEHKTPLSRGGTNDYNNLAVACSTCNCRKHNRTEYEYRNLAKKGSENKWNKEKVKVE